NVQALLTNRSFEGPAITAIALPTTKPKSNRWQLYAAASALILLAMTIAWFVSRSRHDTPGVIVNPALDSPHPTPPQDKSQQIPDQPLRRRSAATHSTPSSSGGIQPSPSKPVQQAPVEVPFSAEKKTPDATGPSSGSASLVGCWL